MFGSVGQRPQNAQSWYSGRQVNGTGVGPTVVFKNTFSTNTVITPYAVSVPFIKTNWVYVAPWGGDFGNSGNGTVGLPFQTLTNALNYGSNIFLLPGTYVGPPIPAARSKR